MGEVHETLAARAAARVGRVVCDRWRLDRLLGVGGVAAVYAARHRNGRRVAVKILHPELAVDASIRRRFLREGYVANRVEHSGAVVVLDDAVDDDGSVLLVMELLEGETLEARCRRHDGRLPPNEVIMIADGVLDVLANAHPRGVLHRDVTPSNVFVTEQGEVKLLDFGIARLRDTDGERTMSVPGALGTPAFMPPEQARGLWEELDARSDLWAVGAVMFRALAGRAVHTGRTSSEQLLAAMTKRARPLRSLCPDVPPGLARVIDRALATEPKKRWPDADAFRAALSEAFLELGDGTLAEAPKLTVPASTPAIDGAQIVTGTHQDGFGTTIREGMQRTRRLRWTVALGGLAVVGGLATALLSGERKPAELASNEAPSTSPVGSTAVPSVPPTVARAAPPTTSTTTASARPPPSTPKPSATNVSSSRRPASSVKRGSASPRTAPTAANKDLEADNPLFDRKD